MANATQITLQESFRYVLPSFNQDSAVYLTMSKNSGASTEATDPPKLWIEYPVENYITRADAELQQDGDRLQAYLPVVESPFMIFTEADVVRAATLYVLHPINEALNARYQDGIYCRSESKQQSGGRCDVVWQAWDSASEDWTVIAVLELKNRGVLDWSDCSGALQNQSNYAQAIQAAWATTENTLFENNMIPIAKQAAHYAWSTGTHYVAVFDWDSLFMFRYERADFESKSIGDWTYGTWVQEDGVATFRKALLGFLLEAYEARTQ
jgi:hypothetical protein